MPRGLETENRSIAGAAPEFRLDPRTVFATVRRKQVR